MIYLLMVFSAVWCMPQHGFNKDGSEPAEQGPYYCGAGGGGVVIGRAWVADTHLRQVPIRGRQGRGQHQRRGHAGPVGVPGTTIVCYSSTKHDACVLRQQERVFYV